MNFVIASLVLLASVQLIACCNTESKTQALINAANRGDNIEGYYADNARRFDNGMPSTMNDARPLDVKQVRCLYREAKNFRMHPVHIARHSERTGSAELKVTFSSDRFVAASLFLDFDHECKIAGEYWNYDTSSADYEWWANKVDVCF